VRRLYPRGGFEGLEANALQVLVALYLQPGLIVADLVEQLLLAQGTVSTALTRLQRRGLVRAISDRDDARRQRQQITPEGRRLVGRFAVKARERVDASGGAPSGPESVTTSAITPV